VDGIDVGEQLVVGAVQETNDHSREIDVVVVTARPVGQPIEQRGELCDHVGGQVREPSSQLRTAQRRDADLGEEDAARAVRRELEKEEVERALEGALRIEDVELGFDRPARVVDDLVDGGDEQVFLGLEVVVDEAGGQIRLGGDALHRRFGEAVLHDRGAQAVDDLSTARLREARSTHG